MRVATRLFLVSFTLLLAAGVVHAQFDCAGVSESDNTDLQAVVVASGLNAPVGVVTAPGDSDRLYIIEQTGQILVHRRGDPPGTNSVFLNIVSRVKSGGEQGLLGVAFSPDWDPVNGGEFWVNYSVGAATCGFFGPCEQVIARHTTNDPDVAPDDETIIMRFDEPQTNHNGGQLMFGPDDMLYIATGDGGGGDDEGTGHGACGNGQDLSTVLGAILRIDVLGRDPMSTGPDTTCDAGYTFADGTEFGVPSDNPFADGTGGDCDEIYAYGLRNPWRNSFDALNGDMYVADVGQNCWEELNYVTASEAAAGVNYGWRQKEATHCFDHFNPGDCDPASTPDCSPACDDPGLTDPVEEYANGGSGESVIGGYVYRGCRMPNFHGTYFYGDNGVGFVSSFEISGGVATNQQNWPTLGGRASLTSFGEDNRGEHYMADAGASQILKIMPPFSDLEVSGSGAGTPFLPHRTDDWTWEDLFFETMHPVEYYQVWKGVPNGTFDCVHSTVTTSWPAGGDPATPNPGELFAYFVTAVNAGEETSTGNPPRTLGTPCAPPSAE